MDDVRNLVLAIKDRIRGIGPGFAVTVTAKPGDWQALLDAIPGPNSPAPQEPPKQSQILVGKRPMPIMTAVFDVPDDVWKLNPFDVETPFGKAVTIARGDLSEDNDRLREALTQIAHMKAEDLYVADGCGFDNAAAMCAAETLKSEE